MNIIAQIDVKVNTENELRDITRAPGADRIQNKWTEKKKNAKVMADKLQRLGRRYTGRAARMRYCAEYIRLQVCEDCGTSHVEYAGLCRDRFCPVCMWRLSMRRFASMYQIIEGLRVAYPEAPWQFVTLTAANCKPEELPQVLDEMYRAWNAITSSKKFKNKVAGWARSLEITFNAEENTIHPHFHILTMWHECTEEPDDYIIDRWLKGVHRYASRKAQDAQTIGWKVDQNLNDDKIVGAVIETYKYSIKDSELEDMPLGTFRAVVEAMGGRRLVAFGGAVKEYAKLCELDKMDEAGDDDTEEMETKIRKCVHCGSAQIANIIAAWAGNGYLWRREQ